MNIFHTVAAHLRIEAETLPLDAIWHALSEGRIDFALGRLPGLRGQGLRSTVLFVDSYDVLMRTGHPASGKPLTREALLEAPHAIVSSASGGHKVLEETLVGLGARVVIRVSNFMVTPMILARTDVMVAVPSRLAKELTKTEMFERYPLPIDLPAIEVCAYWNERFDAEPAADWMRGELIKLFAEHGDVAADVKPLSKMIAPGFPVV